MTSRALADLQAFHACVAATCPDEPGRLAGLAPPHLLEQGADLRGEAAWALLRALMSGAGASPEPERRGAPRERVEARPPKRLDRIAALLERLPAAPEPGQDAPSWDSYARAFLALVPALDSWLAYLQRFPEGGANADYRAERAQSARRWFASVHPEASTLEAFIRKPEQLPSSLRAAVRAHVSGPYNCFMCRAVLESLRTPGQTWRWAPVERLAAASTVPPLAEWRTEVRVKGADRAYTVRYLDDGGYLRVFLEPTEDGEMARRVFLLVLLFADGASMQERLVFPDDSWTGVNLGKLGTRSVRDVIGFNLTLCDDPNTR